MAQGSRLGIFGEPGSGNSTLARVVHRDAADMRAFRRRVQVVRQDHFRSADHIGRCLACRQRYAMRMAVSRPATPLRLEGASRSLTAVALAVGRGWGWRGSQQTPRHSTVSVAPNRGAGLPD